VTATPIPVGGSISLTYPRGFFSLSTLLDVSRSGQRVAIMDTLRSLQILVSDSAASASSSLLISFSPTNVRSFTHLVITLTGFTAEPGKDLTVSQPSFSSSGNSSLGAYPAASASIVNSVLTVTFKSMELPSMRQIIIHNIRNPNQKTTYFSPYGGGKASYNYNVGGSMQCMFSSFPGAATLADSMLLDACTSACIPVITASLRRYSVDFLSPFAGSATSAVIKFTPTNVVNFNRFVITLSNFTSVPGQSLAVSSFAGFSGSPAATATLVSGVLTVTFTSGTLTTGTEVSFLVSNVQNPSRPMVSQITGASTFSSVGVLDTTDDIVNLNILESLRRVSLRLRNSFAGSATSAVIKFTPTKVVNFNRFVITLSNFTSVPGQSLAVSSFAGFSGSPAATATLVSGVLTVTFTSGTLTTGTEVSFLVSNITRPAIPLPFQCSATTHALSNILDSSSTCQITETLISVTISLSSFAAGAQTQAFINFIPTSFRSFNRFVITLTGFSVSPHQNFAVDLYDNSYQKKAAGIAAFGTIDREITPGLFARWYNYYSSQPPPNDVVESWSPDSQNVVSNIDFSPPVGFFSSEHSGMVSMSRLSVFLARFDG
jgi:hypothetical protein